MACIEKVIFGQNNPSESDFFSIKETQTLVSDFVLTLSSYDAFGSDWQQEKAKQKLLLEWPQFGRIIVYH